MSTAVFPFRFLRPSVASAQEGPVWLTDSERSQGGRSAVLARASYSLFRASGTLRLPDPAGNTPEDFDTFVDARQGDVDTFLYLAERARHRQVEGGSLGTATAGQTAFSFSDGTSLHRHLVAGDHDDDDTLKVYVDGTLQVETTDYTVSGNDSDPTVTFVSPMAGSEVVTVDYLFYHSVRFARADFDARILRRLRGTSLDEQELVELAVSLVEDYPGERFAGA